MCGPNTIIPFHITVIYVYAVINLTILFNLALVEANIRVVNAENRTINDFNDLPANFGPRFPLDDMIGKLMLAEPLHGCQTLEKPNISDPIVLMKRGQCNFDIKILKAQEARFIGAIVYNDRSDDLIPMGGNPSKKLIIPSCFVGRTDGDMIKSTYIDEDFSVIIDNRTPFNPNLYLLPFAIVVGICFVLMFIFMLAKCIRDYRKKKKSRLSKEHLKKLPIKKYKKGDQYDVCAICLDDYEEGEKLRVLPCNHAYHMKCIDPWLTKNKRNCPVCKRKVIPGDTESDSETETDDDTASENAPLMGNRSSANTTRQIAGVHNEAALFEDSDVTSTDSSSYNDNCLHRSQAIVHGRGSPASWPGVCHTTYGAINEGFDENRPETSSVHSLGIIPSAISSNSTNNGENDEAKTETLSVNSEADIPTAISSNSIHSGENIDCVVDIVGTKDVANQDELT